jgi:spore germination protein GerM
MTWRRSTTRRWVPAAVALALVAAGCGIPTERTPQIIPRSEVPFRLLQPTTSTTTASPPAFVGVSEQIYLVAPSQTLIPVTRDVPIPAGLEDVLRALLDGPTTAESAAGIQTFLSTGHDLLGVTQSGGVATVDFSVNPIQVVGPDQTLGIAQVVYTLTQQPGVTGVAFEIAGQPIEVPVATGAQAAGPVNRADYGPQAPTL